MTDQTPTSQVPLLDLAPKLKRPLSLWNPLDYLLLLYWVFYFPQAITWYVETFGEPVPESNRLTWQQRWQLIKNSPRKRQLALMGFLIEIAVPILICFSLESFGVPIRWDNVAVGVAVLRPDNRWFSLGSIPRITPLKIPKLTHKLENWLRFDWDKGLMNANQLLKYSLQFISVDVALNQELNALDSSILIARIATLSDLIWDWKALRYCSASLNTALKNEFIDNIFWLPYKSWFKKRLNISLELRFDRPYRSAAAGFWNLSEASLSDSLAAFEDLRHLENGEEIYQLTYILYELNRVYSIQDIVDLQPLSFPPSQSLRPATWSAIHKLNFAIEDARVVGLAASRTSRSFALNRSLGNITEVFNDLKSFPESVSRVERPIIQSIATRYRDLLLDFAGDVGQNSSASN